MLGFIKKLFGVPTMQSTETGFTTPQAREISAEKIQALDSLLKHMYAHIEEVSAKAAVAKVRQHFIAGESLSAAINESQLDSEALAYLAVDIRDPESAAWFADIVSKAHKLNPAFLCDVSDKSVAQVLGEFDNWLAERGYRFVLNVDVDWGYEGFIITESQIEPVINAAKILGIQLELGCQEEE